MQATRPSGLSVHLEVELAASVGAVFEAVTDPQRLATWWGPNGFTTPGIDLELQVGGRYRFTMCPPEGDPFHLQGEFLEIVAPHRLVYTFRWEEPDPDDVETVVRLTLLDRGASTWLTVDHGAFATGPRRELHRRGWSESLERLRSSLAPASPDPRPTAPDGAGA